MALKDKLEGILKLGNHVYSIRTLRQSLVELAGEYGNDKFYIPLLIDANKLGFFMGYEKGQKMYVVLDIEKITAETFVVKKVNLVRRETKHEKERLHNFISATTLFKFVK